MLNREVMLKLGVDQSAGQPDHGDGITTGNDRSSTGSGVSTVTPSGSPGVQFDGPLLFGVTQHGWGVTEQPTPSRHQPASLMIFGFRRRFWATQCANVNATNGEMSTLDVRRDHNHASP